MKTLNYNDWLIKMSGAEPDKLEDNEFNKKQYMDYVEENKIIKVKKITITQTKTKAGVETNFKVEKFSDWEVMGVLSYYNDAFKVNQMRKNNEHKRE